MNSLSPTVLKRGSAEDGHTMLTTTPLNFNLAIFQKSRNKYCTWTTLLLIRTLPSNIVAVTYNVNTLLWLMQGNIILLIQWEGLSSKGFHLRNYAMTGSLGRGMYPQADFQKISKNIF